jgi:hypothetical protein
VEAEQHLPARPAVDVDQGRALAGASAPEQLAVHFDSILGPEHYRLRSDEAARRCDAAKR